MCPRARRGARHGRLHIGAHYLTDVLGGYLAGAIWLIVVMWAFRAAWRRRTHEIATPGSR